MAHNIISEELATFITSGLSITLASRSIENIPSAARAKGCALIRGTNHRIRVFISASEARQLIADVIATGTISTTFSVPETHRTVQFKGFDACIKKLKPKEHKLIEEYVSIFSLRIKPMGFSETFIRAFFASPADEVALEFSPSDAFQQTPGPNAGVRL